MRLFWYILKEYYRYVLSAMVLFLFLFMLFDFIGKAGRTFAEFKPPTELIIKYYFYQIPGQLVQGLPIASLLGSVVSMVILSRTNEVTAMRAAGMGPVRIAAPLAFGGLSVTILMYLIGELLLPYSATRMHYIESVKIEGAKEQEVASGARWSRREEQLFHFNDFDPIGRRLTGLKIVELRPYFRPRKMLDAETAMFVEEMAEWKVENAFVTYFNPNGTIDYTEKIQSLFLPLPIDLKKIQKDRRTPNELGLVELGDVITRGEQSGMDTLGIKVDYHLKLAYPLAAFVVSLISIKFAYTSERTTETAKNVLIAFVIGISYWFIFNAARALGKRGDIPPVFAAWAANVFVLTLALYHGYRSPSDQH